MKKEQAISIICNAAKLYDENYQGKNLLFIYGDKGNPSFIETKFSKNNFLHLTGVVINKGNITNDIPNKNTDILEIFYEKSLYNRLSVLDFEFKEDGSTQQKMSVLSQAMNLPKSAKMIGDFNGNRLKLKTDKVAGSVHSCVGFVLSDGYFIPNTVLADDARNNIVKSQRILAVLDKPISSKEYNSVKSVAKGIDINLLLFKLRHSLDLSENLLPEKCMATITQAVANVEEIPKSTTAYLSRESLKKSAQNLKSKEKSSPQKAHNHEKKHNNEIE